MKRRKDCNFSISMYLVEVYRFELVFKLLTVNDYHRVVPNILKPYPDPFTKITIDNDKNGHNRSDFCEQVCVSSKISKASNL